MKFGKIIILAFLALLICGCSQQQTVQPDGTPSEKVEPVITLKLTDSSGLAVLTKKMDPVPGKNAFELLKQNDVPMVYDEGSYGVFIKEISYLKPRQGEYLALYVDGKYSNVGIKDVFPKEGTVIEFRAEKIDSAQMQ